MSEKRRVRADGEEILYRFEYKRVKNYNMRVHADGAVTVSAPYGASREAVERFVLSHADFIRRARKRLAAREAAKDRPPSDGDTVFYLGVPYTLSLREGERSLSLEKSEMRLTLPDASFADTVLKEELSRLFYPTLLAACQRREPFFLSCGAKAPVEIRLKYMKSMWGNCRKEKGILTFSTLLAAVSPALLDYVVCHEYAHLLHPDHGKGFYALLSRACPDYEEKRRALRERKYGFKERTIK